MKHPTTCAGCIHGTKNCAHIARILWSNERYRAFEWFNIRELAFFLVDNGNDSLGVFLICQRFHYLGSHRLWL